MVSNKIIEQLTFHPQAGWKTYLYLFLLWPFLALITALFNYDSKEAKKVVYIFLIYYGFTFFTQLAGSGVSVDAVRYALYMRENAERPFSDFFNIIGGLYSNETSMDIVEPLISFIVSRFTNYQGFLFATYAAVFSFFYLRSIDLLYKRYRENPEWNGFIHLVFFAAILPVTAINGFRMWTAAWIFFFGAYHVVLFRDARYILVTLASALVHWSFLSANIVIIIYFFAGNRNSIYLPLAILSFVVPRLLESFFSNISLKIGGGLQNRFAMYSDEQYILARQDLALQADWFLQVGHLLVFYYILLAMAIIRFGNRALMRAKTENNLYSFLLLFLSFVNFGKEIPSFGNRFQIVFFLFGTLFIFLYSIKQSGNKISLLTLTGLFPMLLYSAIVFRQGSESINAWILAPGFGLPLLVPGISLAEILF